jgi:hypothetical protein
MKFDKTEIKQSPKRQEEPMIEMREIVEDAHSRAVDIITVIRAALKDISQRSN